MNKKYVIIICLFLFVSAVRSQIMLNGSFGLGATAWGCSAETSAETTYGGSNVLNSVAEIDAAAGLCQTVIGLGIGNIYTLSYQCSRRTGGCPSPNPTNMNVTVSGGALSKTDVRSNTTFDWTTTSYQFTAISNSHTINFSAGTDFGGSTCGMIIDNISVTLFSPLPIELLYFNVSPINENSISLNWETATELNNDFFTIEKSNNSIDWEAIGTIKGAGTKLQSSKYNYTDNVPYSGISYYRLKQTDFNGTYKYTPIQALELNKKHIVSIFPNPSLDHVLKINSNNGFPYSIYIYNSLGEIVFSSFDHLNNNIDLKTIENGIYFLSVSKNNELLYRNRIILQ